MTTIFLNNTYKSIFCTLALLFSITANQTLSAATLAAGGYHTCMVKNDGTLACWGLNDDGRATSPSGTFSQLSVGWDHACALHTDATLICWGRNESSQPAPVVGSFSQISAGYDYTCALKTDATLACWGDNLMIPPTGTFTQISTGWYHACGIKTDGTLACWGKNDYQQATPPEGTFLQVTANGYHSCGIKTDSTVVCWGNTNRNQASPPAGAFTQIVAGFWYTCGIKTDGTLACWGDNDYGQALPPTGSFVQLSAGLQHACGVRTDGTVTCWGDNSKAQATPPPELSLNCSYHIEPPSYFHAASATTGTVTVFTSAAECPWTVSSQVDWITMMSGDGGRGNGIVSYLVSDNTGYKTMVSPGIPSETKSRSGTLTIAGQTITVTQEGTISNCTYLVTPTTLSHRSLSETGAITINVPANCPWTTTSNVDWITITSGNNGQGYGIVTYSVTNNTIAQTRNGVITIADQSVTVNQDAAKLDAVKPSVEVAVPIVSQSVYQEGDLARVTLPPLPAGQSQYFRITLPDNQGTYVLNQLNAFMLFDGVIFPVWQGGEVAIEIPITTNIPRGNYVVELLRMPEGIEPLTVNSNKWSLGTSFLTISGSGGQSQTPSFPGLVQITPTNTDRITLAWLPAVDDSTPAEAMKYEVHLTDQPNFVPSATTLRSVVTGQPQTEVTGLTRGTTYQVLVVAVDQDGHASVERDYHTATTFTDPVIVSQTIKANTDAQLGLGTATTPDGITFTYANAGGILPEVGSVLFSTVGDEMYLRKVTGVTPQGNGVVIQTEDADLAEVLEQATIENEITLFDLEEAAVRTGQSAGTRTTRSTLADGSRYSKMRWEGDSLVVEQIDYTGDMRHIRADEEKDGDKKEDNGESPFEVKPSLKFEPALDVKTSWQRDPNQFLPILTNGHVIASGKLTLTLEATYKFGSAGTFKKEIPIFSRGFTQRYLVGGIPVFQRTIFALKAVLEATAVSGIKAHATVSGSADIQMGAEFNSATGNWEAIPMSPEFNRSLDELGIDVGGIVEGEVRLVPSVTVRFYATVGPQLSIEPFIKGQIKVEPLPIVVEEFGYSPMQPTQFDASFQAQANVGISLRAFGKTFKNLPKVTVWESPEWPLISLPKLSVSGGSGKVGEPITLTASTEDGVNNPFNEGSIRWDVSPNKGSISGGKTGMFVPSEEGSYTVFFSGHSLVGDLYGRQFAWAEVKVNSGQSPLPNKLPAVLELCGYDHDPNAITCGYSHIGPDEIYGLGCEAKNWYEGNYPGYMLGKGIVGFTWFPDGTFMSATVDSLDGKCSVELSWGEGGVTGLEPYHLKQLDISKELTSSRWGWDYPDKLGNWSETNFSGYPVPGVVSLGDVPVKSHIYIICMGDPNLELEASGYSETEGNWTKAYYTADGTDGPSQISCNPNDGYICPPCPIKPPQFDTSPIPLLDSPLWEEALKSSFGSVNGPYPY